MSDGEEKVTCFFKYLDERAKQIVCNSPKKESTHPINDFMSEITRAWEKNTWNYKFNHLRAIPIATTKGWILEALADLITINLIDNLLIDKPGWEHKVKPNTNSKYPSPFHVWYSTKGPWIRATFDTYLPIPKIKRRPDQCLAYSTIEKGLPDKILGEIFFLGSMKAFPVEKGGAMGEKTKQQTLADKLKAPHNVIGLYRNPRLNGTGR